MDQEYAKWRSKLVNAALEITRTQSVFNQYFASTMIDSIVPRVPQSKVNRAILQREQAIAALKDLYIPQKVKENEALSNLLETIRKDPIIDAELAEKQ